MNRREFVKSAALSAAAVGLGGVVVRAGQAFAPATAPEAIKAVLLHLGNNMWCDWFPPDIDLSKFEKGLPDTTLRCKGDLWRKVTDHAAAKELNMVVIDLGEGVVYPSHPELAIAGSWSVNKLRAELDRLRGRIIGKDGRAREQIEDMADVEISVFGKTIGLIGYPEQLKIARTAIDMLIEGVPHENVFAFLDKKKKESKQNMISYYY